MSGDNKYIKALVEKAKKGYHVPFRELYNLNSGRVFAIILRLTADPEIAKQICKNVFIEAWANLSGLRRDVPFTLWVIGIAVYMSLETLRKDESNNKKNKIETILEKEAREEKLKSLLKDKLDLVVTDLIPSERIAFVLHYIEKYSIEETSDLLKVSVYDVNALLNKANLIITEAFADSYVKTPIANKLKLITLIIEAPADIWEEIYELIQKQKFENSSSTVNQEALLEKNKVGNFGNEKPKAESKPHNKKNIIFLSLLILTIISIAVIWLIFMP